MNQGSGVGGPGSAAQAVRMRFAGTIDGLSAGDRAALFDRSTSSDPVVRGRTARIIAEVRAGGDAALLRLARDLDGVELRTVTVPRERMDRALASLPVDLRQALERAAHNIERVHRAMLPQSAECTPEPGIVVTRRPDPLDVVGVYAPGGRAAYPSSVLMGAIPARVAGVRRLVLCSPPDRETGEPSAVVLAAAALAGVDELFAIGGAGAIAAMAIGTASVPRVDRIVGPGNAYVAEAKLQLVGTVGIDAPAGPSELLVLADERADAAGVARELLGQAEHDPLACALAVLFPTHPGASAAADTAAGRLRDAVAAGLARQPRAAVIAESLASRGGVLVARDRAEAVAFAASYAPEHLLLVADDADAIAPELRNAGTVFVGASSSNAFGDYMTGANHVLPTGGLARSWSGLSVLDFIRWTTLQRVTPAAAASLAPDVACLADAEGLPGHALAARAWQREDAR